MKSALVTAVVAIALCRAVSGGELPVSVKKTQSAVVRLIVSDQGGKEIATGNGFFVSADGKLVTSLRLLDTARGVVAITDANEQIAVAGILATDPKNDLALLKLVVTSPVFLPLADVSRILPGLHVAVVSSQSQTEGRIFAVRELFGDLRRIQIKAAIDSNAGGSPVVDPDGAVIGMIRALVLDPRLYNLAIPVEAILKLQVNAGAKPIPFLPRHQSGDLVDVEMFLTDEWQWAVAALELEDWVELLRAGDVLVNRFPNYAEAYACVGTACVELKLYDRATTVYRRVVQLEPDNPIAWINLGNNYSAQGKDGEAVAAYRRVIKMRPHFMVAWTKLGEIYCRQGKYSDAVATWRQAVAAAPDYPPAWANLGVSYEGQGSLDDAVKAYRRAVQLETNYPFAWIRLSVVENQLGRHEEARAAQRHAIKLLPDFPSVWLGLDIGSVVGASSPPER